jgi:uncharacterized protein
MAHARRQLSRVDQVGLDRDLLDAAATLALGTVLRSLDAMHLACAGTLGADLRTLITYDERMRDAATTIGLVVEAPV